MAPLKSTLGAASAFGWLPRVPVNPTLTNVEYTLWSGGYYAGSPVIKATGSSVVGGIPYTITVGAASSASAFSGGAINEYIYSNDWWSTGNSVNGVWTTYAHGANVYLYYSYSWYQNFGGWFYFNANQYFPPNGNFQIGDGYAGAAGNGGQVVHSASHAITSGNGGAGFTPTSSGLAGFPTVVGCGGNGYKSAYQANGEAYDSNWNYYGNASVYMYDGTIGSSGANTGNGSYAGPSGSGGFTMRYSNTQLPLTSTTGDVVYLNSGGYHNYFWKSTGSFIV